MKSLPPLDVQKQIVAEIENKQSAIDNARDIIKNLEREGSYFASLLEGVECEVINFEKVASTITPPKKLQTNEFYKIGRYQIIDQSQNEIAGYSDDETAVINIEQPVVVFGDHTCVVKYVEDPFIQGADGIKILKTSNNILPKYLYYYLLCNPLTTKGYKRHFSELKLISILVPSLEEQKRIVEILDEEQNVINVLKKTIKHLNDKINAVIARIYNNKG